MANDIDRILEHEWTKGGVEEFIEHCWDRQALMAALIGFARAYMTHRILMRLRKGAFHPFALQGWPDHVDEQAKTPRLRKLQLPAATTSRVRKALTEGHPLAAPPAEFGLKRVLQFLGEEPDEEFLCEPVTVGPHTEWVLIGKPIRIDPNSHAFSSDAITLKFWELEDVCDKVGAQYQRIRRLGKHNKLPPPDEQIPPLNRPAKQAGKPAGSGATASGSSAEAAFGMSNGFEPVEVNKRTQQRINADAGGFSAERFLAGEDAFSGEARPSSGDFPAVDPGPSGSHHDSEVSDLYDAPDDEDVGVTTGVFKIKVDPRSMAEVNYGQSSHSDDAPALADIEHTGALQLDESVLSDAKKAYHRTLEREERERKARQARERQDQTPHRPAAKPITAEEKARVRKAIAMMDSSDRDQAFNAASYVASFGDRAVKTLGRLFPGRLFVDRYQFQASNLPPVEQHSPVLYALVALGEPARKVTRHYINDNSIDLRFYATYLYTRLSAEDDIELIFERLFDRDRQTRHLAQRVIAGLRHVDERSYEYMVLEPLRRELERPQDEFRQTIAIETLGRCRDIPSIEPLIEILKFKSGRPVQLAHKALRRISLQNFSAAAVSWTQWWNNQRPDYSDQWLVAALDSDSEEIRHIAWQEVNRLDGVELDYNPNYPARRRQEAQQDLAIWLGVQTF